jgi:signal transduction histidine kinase
LLTKIENNQFKENKVINVNDIIFNSLEQQADFIKLKNITIHYDSEPDLLVKMNPVLADVLISNLIRNAIRHNFENGDINISINENTLIISNSGELITINQKEMFLRFKKNDSSKDSLGLGLSIVKSILDLYNFTISYSYINSMHTFSIKF